MIRLLQKMKAKRGFTMIELIVVLAVIGVILAMLLTGLDTKKALINEANSAARDMYNTAQAIFTKYSLTEAPLNLGLKDAANTAEKDAPPGGTKTKYEECVRFYKKAGGNFPCIPETITVSDMPKTTELYIEVSVDGGQIKTVNVSASTAVSGMFDAPKALQNLLRRKADTEGSTFGVIFKNDIESRMDVHDGYYYVRVKYTAPPAVGGKPADYTNPVKVVFAAYSKTRIPQAPDDDGGWSTYRLDNLDFTKANITKNGQIIGVVGGQVDRGAGTDKLTRGYKGTSLGHDTYTV